MAVANRVREIRETLGISVQTLADRAEIQVRGLREIEAGRRSPTIETARKITVALGARDLSVVFPTEETGVAA